MIQAMRERCPVCLQPDFSCYCAWLEPFACEVEFVILTHPLETRRRIATGRMSHLTLRGSHLIRGHDYTHNERLNGLLAREDVHSVMLYPGRGARDLGALGPAERSEVWPEGRRLSVIVIDGTWSTARKTVNRSRNLHLLPRVCFTPPTPSRFRVRRQPRPECYSTIEAIHRTIDLLGAFGPAREHDRLLRIFDRMVDRQVELASGRRSWRHLENYRRREGFQRKSSKT